MASSLSKPTDARSSAMAGHENKSHKKAAKNDLTGILQCTSFASLPFLAPTLSHHLTKS